MVELDGFVAAAGLLVGIVVGLTGMGGGALMTPLLVLGFGIEPLAAVSSDLVAATVMKPVGGSVHWRRGTVHRSLVVWLMLGSIPSAFVGVLCLHALGDGEAVQSIVKGALGVALLLACAALVTKDLLVVSRAAASRADEAPAVRRVVTVAIGCVGGLIVGMTSVGSGSLMMVLLLIVYPTLRLRQLVGTDLVQAVPLVASAALAHVFFGDFRWGLTVSILIGAVPGAYLGARLSSRAPDRWIRPVLVVALLASSLKLLGIPTGVTGWILLTLVAVAATVALVVRRRGAPKRVAAPEGPRLPDG